MNSRSALQGTAFLTILLVPIFAFTQTISTPPRPIDSSSYGKLPLSFEANQGQVDPAVQFLSHGRGYTLLLREGEAGKDQRKVVTPYQANALVELA